MNNIPNILIVDDTKENLILLESILTKIEVNIIQALSGAEALTKTVGIDIAVAIIDVRMPGMDGHELAFKINVERTGKVPVIFLTAANFDKIEVFKGYDSGAVDYIFKPVNNHILTCKINIFLDLFKQRQTIVRDVKLLKESADKLIIANNALQTSEEKYRSYIENAPDGVFVIDENGRYIEVNEAACKITGYSKDELLKMSVSDLLPGELLEDGLAHFRKVVETGTSKGDLVFKHRNGTIRWWTIEAVKLTETRFLGFAKDITERKKAEETLYRKDKHYKITIENIFKFIPEGILVFTESMRLLKQNKAFGDIIRKHAPILGYTEEELAQKIIEQFSSEILSGEKTEIRIYRKSL